MHPTAILEFASLPWCLPFALLLLAIAVMPLAWPHFWEPNRNKALVVALLAVPVATLIAWTDVHRLQHAMVEYLSFILLLAALFVISGGIFIEGDLEAKPSTNLKILLVGAVLANVVGTTGASMLLIRPLLRTNRQRKHIAHIPVFFILIVSNCAGLLTPLGDPPLFLGFLQGVPFFWTLRLWPAWLLAMTYLCCVFFFIDRRAYQKERPEDVSRDVGEATELRVDGKINFVLLALVVASVFLPTPYREVALVACTAASMQLTTKQTRTRNAFTMTPILEVAILFLGIFVTMIPALALLNARAHALGVTRPWQFFLLSGALSSVLDNAPTYLTFLSAAGGLELGNEVAGVPHIYLMAISIGAVFMGANTYIGNGPNFMVKAIAEESGVRMPTFGGYAFTAITTLLPLYVVLTLFFALTQ